MHQQKAINFSKPKPSNNLAVAVAAEDLIKQTFSYTSDAPRGAHSWLRNPMYSALVRMHQEIHLANETFVDYAAIKHTLSMIRQLESQDIKSSEQLFYRQAVWQKQLRSFQRRLEHITQAIVELKTVCMYMRIFFEKQWVSKTQYEKWSEKMTDVQLMLGGWKASERKRAAPSKGVSR